jgi:hypothetical protein
MLNQANAYIIDYTIPGSRKKFKRNKVVHPDASTYDSFDSIFVDWVGQAYNHTLMGDSERKEVDEHFLANIIHDDTEDKFWTAYYRKVLEGKW